MARPIIGIQGGIGSVNEKGCRFFAEKHKWLDYSIRYLVITENVLHALSCGEIDYGTFAWESTRAGLVVETQQALTRYSFTKFDEHWFCPDHALLMHDTIDESQVVTLYSHHQALREHSSYLLARFANVTFREEVDTSVAAEKLSRGCYGSNTLVIAPLACAAAFNLQIFEKDLPSNEGYLTKIILATR